MYSMKTKIKSLASILLVNILCLPLINQKAMAAQVTVVNPIGTDDFTELVTNFLGWLLGIAGALALLMFVWGGILYVTSAGDEQKAAKGKRIVTWTIIGLIVILMSYSIIVLIEDIFINE